MSLTPSLRLQAPPGPAAMTRLITVVLALMMIGLGVMAAHHAQTAQSAPGHAVVVELKTAHQPVSAEGHAPPDFIVGDIAVGLATGCIVLIACCALGLALMAARAWRADLFRRLIAAARSLPATIIDAAPGVAGVPRPSLIALSISRT